MEKIKYRAWDLKTKTMKNVIDIAWFDNGNMRVNCGKCDKYYDPLIYMANYKGNEYKEFELMLSSGINDKKRTSEYPNGQEMYQDDIVRYKDNTGEHIGIIKYGKHYVSKTEYLSTNCLGFYIEEINNIKDEQYTSVYNKTISLLSENIINIEVIGDKYQNSELLI